MDDLKYYKKGLAVGHSDIRDDSFHFRYYDEFFVVKNRTLKTRNVFGKLVAKIEDVRKLKNG